MEERQPCIPMLFEKDGAAQPGGMLVPSAVKAEMVGEKSGAALPCR